MFDFLKRKKKITVNKQHEGMFVVQEINVKSSHLAEGLGIDKERYEFLGKELLKAYVDSKNMCEAMNKASVHCKHANELFYLSVILWEHHNKQMRAGMMNQMMSSLFKGKE